MAGQLRFDGKVVLITGAGNGLGREYALAFGERGAKVVVNDLGGDIKGGGKSSRAADVVVDEIKAKGGTAVANYDSVEDGEKVVQTALDNFGRIDIVINNAGILRDRSFARTSDLDWDLVHRVHLRGSFLITRAAWPHMKDNKYGKIIMTTSAAGIYGNFGQANYSAAKLGLYGLSQTLSIEGQKYNISSNTIAPIAGSRLTATVWGNAKIGLLGLGQTLNIEGRKYNISCNIIAPIAGSRMTATVMPDDMLDAMKPGYVMPLVLWLCHEDCPANGELFEVGGGWVSKLRWQRTQGAMLRGKNRTITPEAVRDSWDEITDFTDPYYPLTTGESGGFMYQKYLEAQSEIEDDSVKPNATSANIVPNATASKIDPAKAIGAQIPESEWSYTDREVMLYALGVGVTTKQDDFLKFLFEYNEDFCVIPTFAVLPIFFGTSYYGPQNGLEIDVTKILHGEQYLELYKPLATSGKLISKGVVSDILDKGSGAVIIADITSFDENGEKVAFNQTTTFVQKAGGFGGKRSSDKSIDPIPPPNRAPDATVKEKTGLDQAALYRLSGDRNPLHIDPSFAAMGGFSTPILHGLCSFGYAVRHVLQTYAGNDVTKFKAVKVRFSKPVLPGETIQTDMWKEGNRIFFQCKVVESGATSLSGSYVDLHDSNTVVAQPASASVQPVCESDVLFKIASARIGTQPELTKQINAIFQFNVLKDKKQVSQWTVDMKANPGKCYPGQCKDGKPGVTVTMEDADIIDLATGKLAGPKAFLSGKMKLKGNIMLAQKMGTIFMDLEKAKL